MASANGFILGLIGGLLDFASASLLLLSPRDATGMMDAGAAEGWGVVLLALGLAVVVTSILSVQSIGIRRGKVFSLLMVLYGIVMVAVGLSMTTGYIPMVTGISVIYSYGMVLVGGAMVVNGLMMSRTTMLV